MGAYFTITAIAPGAHVRALQGLRHLEAERGDHVDVYSCESGALLCMPGQLLYDSEGVAAALSKSLGLPVIDLHFSDDVVWGYALFQEGREVDRYSSRPNYWEKLSELEIEKHSGNALVVARVWTEVKADDIIGYLTNKESLTEETERLRAYDDDRYQAADAWQLCDFMRKLGLDYPFDEEGEYTTQLITSLKIGTAKGLAQKADLEDKFKDSAIWPE